MNMKFTCDIKLITSVLRLTSRKDQEDFVLHSETFWLHRTFKNLMTWTINFRIPGICVYFLKYLLKSLKVVQACVSFFGGGALEQKNTKHKTKLHSKLFLSEELFFQAFHCGSTGGSFTSRPRVFLGQCIFKHDSSCQRSEVQTSDSGSFHFHHEAPAGCFCTTSITTVFLCQWTLKYNRQSKPSTSESHCWWHFWNFGISFN